MAKANSTITQARIQELLHYDPETGVFTRKKPGPGIAVGQVCGTVDQEGYVRARVDMKTYGVHRLAWLYVKGQFPAGEVDHINGNRRDNRIENLRDVSKASNLQNQKRAQAGSRSGLLGAYYNQGKWRAAIQTNGMNKNLGNFNTPEEAHQAYLAAKRVLHSTCTI
jgi:hypothetical protein